jgi:hypothetical protein
MSTATLAQPTVCGASFLLGQDAHIRADKFVPLLCGWRLGIHIGKRKPAEAGSFAVDEL